MTRASRRKGDCQRGQWCREIAPEQAPLEAPVAVPATHWLEMAHQPHSVGYGRMGGESRRRVTYGHRYGTTDSSCSCYSKLEENQDRVPRKDEIPVGDMDGVS